MNQRREENDQILCSALRRYAQEESSGLPSAEELSGVTFTKAYEKRKRQILRAKGRPAGVKVLHGKRSRQVLRIGVVAALLAVVAMTSVFSNLNSKQDFAGFEIDMDNYLGVIAAPTTPDGFLVENTNPYLEQPDGDTRPPTFRRITHWKPIRVMVTNITAIARMTASFSGQAAISPSARAIRVVPRFFTWKMRRWRRLRWRASANAFTSRLRTRRIARA